jgi:hypothetical protein
VLDMLTYILRPSEADSPNEHYRKGSCFHGISSTKLVTSASFGRAGAGGMLLSILQVMLQGPRSWALKLAA